jgi:hypothetical protein
MVGVTVAPPHELRPFVHPDFQEEEEMDLLKHPLGLSASCHWGIFRYNPPDNHELPTMVECLPSLTNLVPNSTRGVSLALRMRLAYSVAAILRFLRNVAGLNLVTFPEREEVMRYILDLHRAENEAHVNEVLAGTLGHPAHPLSSKYVSPQRAGGLATVASHGPQMVDGPSNGGKATVASHGPQMSNGPLSLGSGPKVGSSYKTNKQTT